MFIIFAVLNMEYASSCVQNSVNGSSCIICAHNGRRSKLQLCRLNSEEAVYICSYPEVRFTVMHSVYVDHCLCDTVVCSIYSLNRYLNYQCR